MVENDFNNIMKRLQLYIIVMMVSRKEIEEKKQQLNFSIIYLFNIEFYVYFLILIVLDG